MVQELVHAVVQEGYGGPEVFRVTTRPPAAPGPGEVLVAVEAAGLDRGTWHLMAGRPYLVRLVLGWSAPRVPVPGRDVAGTVVALGPGVTELAVGDAVFGISDTGSYAERVVVRVAKLARRPTALSADEAAVLGVSGLTALQAIEAAGVVTGERVLVLGASGGVGSYAVQLLAARGAVVTAVCSAAKAARVRGWGAARVLDHHTEDPTAGAEPYDVILDIAGNTPLARLRRVLAPAGRLVFVGGEAGGDWSGGFERQLGAMLLGPFTRQRFLPFLAKEDGADLARLSALVEQGALRPVVHAVHPVSDVAGAMRSLVAGEVCGKLALRVAGNFTVDP